MLVLHDLELWVERCIAALCSLTVTLVLEPGVKVIPELTDQSRDTSANRSWLRAVPHKVMYFSNIFTTSWNGGWVILTEFYLCSSRFFFCSLRKKKKLPEGTRIHIFYKTLPVTQILNHDHEVPCGSKENQTKNPSYGRDQLWQKIWPGESFMSTAAVSEVILEEGAR